MSMILMWFSIGVLGGAVVAVGISQIYLIASLRKLEKIILEQKLYSAYPASAFELQRMKNDQ